VAREKSIHRCSGCGSVFHQWAGRCTSCGAWNTLVPELIEPELGPRAFADGAGQRGQRGTGTGTGSRSARQAAVAGRRRSGAGRARLSEAHAGAIEDDDGDAVERGGLLELISIDSGCSPLLPTGVPELDRVLGGGLVAGSVTLIGGEPGIGKSTLLLQSLSGLARAGRTALLVAGEESPEQISRRARRIGAAVEGIRVLADTDLDVVLAAVAETSPDVVVVDSIQTLNDNLIGSSAGTVTQVRECATALVNLAKSTGTVVLLVGHVTKDGALAGPRALEHVVDTVLSFEGERHHALRLLSAVKHRFGATGELGVLEMTDRGLVGVDDPSGMLLAERKPGIAGSVVVPLAEGPRPILVELQALVSRSPLANPRRSAQGLPSGRLALIIAVLEQRVGLSLFNMDVFASVVGGARISEPAADLGLGLALASAASGIPLPGDIVACGEVGLGGEVRQVSRMARRLGEARRLGFRRAVVSASAPAPPRGLEIVRVGTLFEAVTQVIEGKIDGWASIAARG
jgi:DNA repair protein RadA/Sms